jgi:hypothetical protein
LRFPLLELPGDPRPLTRPVVPVQIEDLEEAPLYCLLDSGATANRMSAELAELAGVSLDEPLAVDEIAVAGLRTTGRCIRVGLTVASHRFEAPVWFCDPWPFGFGLLGHEGFFRFFRVTFGVAEGWVDCVPESARAGSAALTR